MNFKEWLLTEENSIPEDDGTIFWIDKIASKNPKSLLDIAYRYLISISKHPNRSEKAHKDDMDKLNEIKSYLSSKKINIIESILDKNGPRIIGYVQLTGFKNYDTGKNKKYAEDTEEYINYVKTNYENRLPKPVKWYTRRDEGFVYTLRNGYTIKKDMPPEKQKYADLPVKGKIYPDIKTTDPNFFVAMKKIMEYYATGMNRNIYTWSQQFKFPESLDRRDTLILYLSEEGSKNKSIIQNDLKKIFSESGVDFSGIIQFGYDLQAFSNKEDKFTFNAYKSMFLSLLAVISHMDDEYIKKSINYLKEKKDKFKGNEHTLAIDKSILSNIKNYEPLNNYLRSRNINLESAFNVDLSSEDQPETSPNQPEAQSDKTGAIHLGKVHVQLAGNNLKVQGSKAMFDVRLEPNQLQQIANLTKLEAVMGNDPVTPVDLTKGANPAGIAIKNLGNADVHISKTALHLNNIQIPLKPQQVQYILNMLGMDETAFEQGDMKNSIVHLTAENGKTVKINTSFFIGKNHFGDIPDFNRFFSDKQFNLTKDPSGSWTIQHNPSAINQTYLNGMPLSQPQKLSSGMKVTVGKSGKCPLTIEIK